MKATIFADTNVFLDAILQRVSAAKECSEILELAHAGEIKIYTSVSCLMNVMYFMQKTGIASVDTIQIVEVLLKAISLCSPDEKTFSYALRAGFSDLEDAVQYHTALQVKSMGYFITSNIKDFRKASSQLPVITPKQFIKLYGS